VVLALLFVIDKEIRKHTDEIQYNMLTVQHIAFPNYIRAYNYSII